MFDVESEHKNDFMLRYSAQCVWLNYVTVNITVFDVESEQKNDFMLNYSAHCVWLNYVTVNITLFDVESERAPGRLIQSPNIGWKTKISSGIKEKDSVLAELRNLFFNWQQGLHPLPKNTIHHL